MRVCGSGGAAMALGWWLWPGRVYGMCMGCVCCGEVVVCLFVSVCVAVWLVCCDAGTLLMAAACVGPRLLAAGD